MVQANLTIFKFYVTLIEFLSEALSKKYPKASLEDPHHYETVILNKIVHMFHSLELLVIDGKDEVSARCILRGILDSVTTYCFIYERENNDEILFRHYLYILDSFSSNKKCCTVYSDVQIVEPLLDDIIKQTIEKLQNHPFYKLEPSVVEELINDRNWKYKSFEDTNKMRYKDMYKSIGFNDDCAVYYSKYLSQFVHGLCISNKVSSNMERMKQVLYESIPIADRFVQSLKNTFQAHQMIMDFLVSSELNGLIEKLDFNLADSDEFSQSLLRNESGLYV